MKTVTVSSKGQIAIPKDVMANLHITGGDKLLFDIKEGRIILEPAINVPRSQAWFWNEKIQEKIRKAERNFKAGKSKRYEDVKDFLKDLKDE
jgi:AbrB family looped-hinge helix DNA binding protein